MRRVIITGAGGFIGSMLTRKMVENGVEVLAVSQEFGADFPSDPMVSRVEATIGCASALVDAAPKVEYDAFFHLAWAGVNGPEKSDPIVQLRNTGLAVECASASKQLGCKKFLCAGTVAERVVESLPNLERIPAGAVYGVAKHCTRLMLEAYSKSAGLDCVWMQFSNAYGPSNRTGNLISYTLGKILCGNDATFGPADQPYDFIYADDLVEAVFRLGLNETRKNFYFIGSGEPRILKDYLLAVGAACGRVDCVKIGARPGDGISYKADMFDTSDLVADIGKYVPLSFEDRIAYTIENYKI